jgi:hypothetical protein
MQMILKQVGSFLIVAYSLKLERFQVRTYKVAGINIYNIMLLFRLIPWALSF